MYDFSTEVIAGVHLIEPQQRSLENPNLPLNDPQIWEEVFGSSSKAETGQSITAEKALMYAPFWHAVQMISGDIAKLPLNVYIRRPELGDDAREKDRGHPLNRLLSVAPNEETEAVKFWCRYMSDALIWNNAYAFIERDGSGMPIGLYNLLPDRTRAERVDGRLIYVTEVNGGSGAKLKALLPSDVLHIEGLSACGTGAAAVFRMARNSIALGLAQERFASKFFRYGGRVGGILELPSTMTKVAKDRVEEGFRKTYEESDAPFKTIVLRDNAKFHEAQQSPRDSQMVEATEGQTRQIAHWFSLSPSKLGLSDSVSYNSKAEDNQAYLDSTLAIWLLRIASACNFKLIDPNDTERFCEHNTASLLRMNLLAQAQAFQILIGSRVMNPNECRGKLNMLPYEGGEVFVNPNTMTSGTPDGQGNGNSDKQQDSQQPSTPARSDDYLRMLFEITSRAREKAKKPDKFIDWVDGNLAPHRADYKGAEPFPFDAIVTDLKRNLEHWKAAELAERVEEWTKILETEKPA